MKIKNRSKQISGDQILKADRHKKYMITKRNAAECEYDSCPRFFFYLIRVSRLRRVRSLRRFLGIFCGDKLLVGNAFGKLAGFFQNIL